MVEIGRSIWHFDATSNIVGQHMGRRGFLYSIVCHDIDNKKIIPVADFMSYSQTATDVSTFLFWLKIIFQRQSVPLPRIAVTDHDDTLINAILFTFNNCSYFEYLAWSFQLIVNNRNINGRIKVIVALCATHKLKNVIDAANKWSTNDGKKDKVVRKCFIYCFTLLQSGSSIEDFETILEHIFVLFKTEYESERVDNSYKSLQRFINQRGLQTIDTTGTRTRVEKVRDSIFHELQNNSDDEINNKKVILKHHSPWKIYFERFLKKIAASHFVDDLERDLIASTTVNHYYAPDLFKIIFELLHIVPLWSGIMLNECSKNGPKKLRETLFNNRITNNFVENWYDQVKNKLLKGKTIYVLYIKKNNWMVLKTEMTRKNKTYKIN